MSFSFPIPHYVCATALALASFSTFADTPTASDPIDRVVVSATRSPTALDTVGDSVTVIDGEQARASQKATVADLLATTPGVAVSSNGGLGTTTSLFIRGAEARQTVVLIDGVKVNDPASPDGGFDFSKLLLDDVERIEIVRGAQSTLWGSQAIGGVVNVVTSIPKGPFAGMIDAQGGSYGTGNVTARIQQGTEEFGWRLGAAYLRTDGISVFDEAAGGREDDGYRNVRALARGFWKFGDNVTAELRSNWSRGRTEIDGFPAPLFDFADTRERTITEESVSYAGLAIDSLGGRWQHRLGIGYTDTNRENRDPDALAEVTFEGSGSNTRYEYQGTLALADDVTTVFGAERERSSIDTLSRSDFTPAATRLDRDVELDSVYAQLQVTLLRSLTLTGGLRYDDHETFGNHTSVHSAAAWAVSEATRLRASYGDGFKAPTLFQLYSEFGSLDLEPEEGSTWDAGIEQRLLANKLVASVTYFERDTKKLIDFVSCFGVDTPRCNAQPGGYFDNLLRTTARGYEVAATASLSTQVTLTTNYTYLDATNEDRTSEDFGKQLIRRPKHSANAELSYRFRTPLTAALAARYSGRSFDTNFPGRATLDDYLLVDLRAQYAVSDVLQIYGRIENVFDEAHPTVFRYGSTGRTGYLGLRQTF